MVVTASVRSFAWVLVGPKAPLHILRPQRSVHDAFRQKSSTDLNELAELARRYSTFRFAAVSNILPNDFATDFLPARPKKNATTDIFFEIRSTASRAGKRRVTPGRNQPDKPGIRSIQLQTFFG